MQFASRSGDPAVVTVELFSDGTAVRSFGPILIPSGAKLTRRFVWPRSSDWWPEGSKHEFATCTSLATGGGQSFCTVVFEVWIQVGDYNGGTVNHVRLHSPADLATTSETVLSDSFFLFTSGGRCLPAG